MKIRGLALIVAAMALLACTVSYASCAGTGGSTTTTTGATTTASSTTTTTDAIATGTTAPATTTTSSSTTTTRWLDAVCYGPYRDNEDPLYGILPTADELAQDLSFISKITGTIRTYGATGTVREIPELCQKYGLDCYAGAWLSKIARDNDKEIRGLTEIASEHLPCVKALIVGNEVLLRGDLSEEQLISYIERVKHATNGIQVGTADDIEQFLEHPKVVGAVDIMFVHIHPYWKYLSIDKAAEYVVQRWREITARYPGKAVVIGETGWPSEGDAMGDAVPSEENQRQFIKEFVPLAAKNGIKYCFFDVFDEKWKAPEDDAAQQPQDAAQSYSTHTALSDGFCRSHPVAPNPVRRWRHIGASTTPTARSSLV